MIDTDNFKMQELDSNTLKWVKILLSRELDKYECVPELSAVVSTEILIAAIDSVLSAKQLLQVE